MGRQARIASVLMVVVLAVGAVAIADNVARLTGMYQVWQAQTEARAAEARAAEAEARAQELRERQALVQTRVLALASLKDSALVTVTYIGGGLALLAAVVVIGVLLYERGGRRRNDDESRVV